MCQVWVATLTFGPQKFQKEFSFIPVFVVLTLWLLTVPSLITIAQTPVFLFVRITNTQELDCLFFIMDFISTFSLEVCFYGFTYFWTSPSEHFLSNFSNLFRFATKLGLYVSEFNFLQKLPMYSLILFNSKRTVFFWFYFQICHAVIFHNFVQDW